MARRRKAGVSRRKRFLKFFDYSRKTLAFHEINREGSNDGLLKPHIVEATDTGIQVVEVLQ